MEWNSICIWSKLWMKLMTDISSDRCRVSGKHVILHNCTFHIHPSSICGDIRELSMLLLLTLHTNIRSYVVTFIHCMLMLEWHCVHALTCTNFYYVFHVNLNFFVKTNFGFTWASKNEKSIYGIRDTIVPKKN